MALCLSCSYVVVAVRLPFLKRWMWLLYMSEEIWIKLQAFLLCNEYLLLLRYLAKNSATLFSASDYEVAPPEYHRKAV